MVTAGDGLAVELLGRQLPVLPRRHGAHQGLKQVEARIRPQALRLAPPSPDRIRGVVFLASHWASRTRYSSGSVPTPTSGSSPLSGHNSPRAPAGLEFSPADLYSAIRSAGTPSAMALPDPR